MTIAKKNISERISKDLTITLDQSHKLLDEFINVLKSKSSSGPVKISRFGSFSIKLSPQRLGRNPKSKETYVIKKRMKLTFKPSHLVRKAIN
ncbi:HU family DNA-binding protein [Gammaproteobacteria bacterium]|nr:HU family DNA-binding protein [Gammaproteobacteria bacterium]